MVDSEVDGITKLVLAYVAFISVAFKLVSVALFANFIEHPTK